MLEDGVGTVKTSMINNWYAQICVIYVADNGISDLSMMRQNQKK